MWEAFLELEEKHGESTLSNTTENDNKNNEDTESSLLLQKKSYAACLSKDKENNRRPFDPLLDSSRHGLPLLLKSLETKEKTFLKKQNHKVGLSTNKQDENIENVENETTDIKSDPITSTRLHPLNPQIDFSPKETWASRLRPITRETSLGKLKETGHNKKKIIHPNPTNSSLIKPPQKVMLERQIRQRQKQLSYGKNTPAYLNYIQNVTIPERTQRKDHPSTPNPYQTCSKRSWEGQYRLWRRALHLWDPPSIDQPT